MGDFIGCNNSGLQEYGDKLTETLIVKIDVGIFNEDLARFSPEHHLPITNAAESVIAIHSVSI